VCWQWINGKRRYKQEISSQLYNYCLDVNSANLVNTQRNAFGYYILLVLVTYFLLLFECFDIHSKKFFPIDLINQCKH